MAEVDIYRLYRFLIDNQELDPEVARRLLQQILTVLQEMRRKYDEEKQNRTDERVEKDL